MIFMPKSGVAVLALLLTTASHPAMADDALDLAECMADNASESDREIVTTFLMAALRGTDDFVAEVTERLANSEIDLAVTHCSLPLSLEGKALLQKAAAPYLEFTLKAIIQDMEDEQSE